MNNIEKLLSVPMQDIEDLNFSTNVLSKIVKFNHQRIWILTSLYSLLGLLFIAFFPVLTWLKAIKTFMFNHGFSTTSLAINNQAIIEVFSQPAIILALSMVSIFIFTRMEG